MRQFYIRCGYLYAYQQKVLHQCNNVMVFDNTNNIELILLNDFIAIYSSLQVSNVKKQYLILGIKSL